MKRDRLTDAQISEHLESVPAWECQEGRLRREFATGSFVAGVGLVRKVSDIAEELNHHPDVLLTYPRVRIEIHTHEVGGITEFDFELARRIDDLKD